jgi:23S rRNA-/tRNA-specific pseudouridylate synthase
VKKEFFAIIYLIYFSDGKESVTEFELLSTDGSASVVLARPVTSRMHQIRVHLQYLGT